MLFKPHFSLKSPQGKMIQRRLELHYRKIRWEKHQIHGLTFRLNEEQLQQSQYRFFSEDQEGKALYNGLILN